MYNIEKRTLRKTNACHSVRAYLYDKNDNGRYLLFLEYLVFEYSCSLYEKITNTFCRINKLLRIDSKSQSLAAIFSLDDNDFYFIDGGISRDLY